MMRAAAVEVEVHAAEPGDIANEIEAKKNIVQALLYGSTAWYIVTIVLFVLSMAVVFVVLAYCDLTMSMKIFFILVDLFIMITTGFASKHVRDLQEAWLVETKARQTHYYNTAYIQTLRSSCHWKIGVFFAFIVNFAAALFGGCFIPNDNADRVELLVTMAMFYITSFVIFKTIRDRADSVKWN